MNVKADQEDVLKFVDDCERESNHMSTLLGVHVLAKPVWQVLTNFANVAPDWCQYFKGEYNQNTDNLQLILTSRIREPGRIFMQLHGWVMGIDAEDIINQGFERTHAPYQQTTLYCDTHSAFGIIAVALMKELDDGFHSFFYKVADEGFVMKVLANRSPLMYQMLVNTKVFKDDNAYIKEQAELLKGNSKQT